MRPDVEDDAYTESQLTNTRRCNHYSTTEKISKQQSVRVFFPTISSCDELCFNKKQI